MSRGILFFVASDELHELLHPPLLKNTHQWRPDGLESVGRIYWIYFHLVGGNFSYPSITVDVAPCNLLELEVSSDISVLE